MRNLNLRPQIALIGFTLLVPLAAASAQTATPFANEATAPQTLSVMQRGFTIPETAEPIAVGDTIDGEFTDEAPAFAYTFEGESGQLITATLAAPVVDTYLVLADEDGTILMTNDDGAGSLDARLTYAAEAGVTYTLVATTYGFYNGTGNSSVGEFTLTFEADAIDLIEYSQTVEGSLTTEDLAAYFAFSGQAGDVVVITHTSGAFDSILTLLGPDGFELTYDDDSAGDLDARIGPYVLPQTGLYQIVASSLSGMGTGEFSVSLERAQVSALTLGETATATFERDTEAVYFQFEARFDDVITLTVDADFDTRAALNDPSGFVLVTDEDSGEGLNPEFLDLVLGSDGTYTLIISAVSPGMGGDVSVTLTRSELPTLNDGPITLVFSGSSYQRRATFTPEIDTRYQVTIRTNSTSSQVNIDLTQFGSSIASVSANYVNEASFEFTAFSDNEIQVNVYDYSGIGNSVELSIAEIIE